MMTTRLSIIAHRKGCEKQWNFNIILANFEINYSRNTSFCHEFILQEQWVPEKLTYHLKQILLSIKAFISDCDADDTV